MTNFGGAQEFTTWDGEPVSRDRPHGAMVVVASRAPQGWRYLLLHRAHDGGPAREGDWAWTPPSGSRKPGEDLFACVARELREEAGWEASPRPVRTTDVDWAVFALEVPWDTEVVVDGEEHDRFEWVDFAEARRRCLPAELEASFLAGCPAAPRTEDDPMPAHQSPPSEPASDNPAGARYPSTARIWNYQLGGTDNFAIDRQASDAANAMVRDLGVPAGAVTAQESRHLLQRMVDYMLGQGVRQFLDLGSGLPNMASTHQIAHRVAPEARVVYVDADPMVSSHAAALSAGPGVATLAADLRDPGEVLGDAQVRDLLDFEQPVGLMFMCVLHCLWDSEDPWGVVQQFRDAVVPGSYLALTHMTDEAHPQAADGLFRMTQELHWNTPLISRSRADIGRFFDGFTLVEPGLVTPGEWRPDLDNPLRAPGPDKSSEEPVIQPLLPQLPDHGSGVAWHFCGIGVRD